MRQRPLRAVFAQAQQLLAPAKNFTRQVIERVRLMRPLGHNAKACFAQLAGEFPQVGDAKLDLNFPG